MEGLSGLLTSLGSVFTSLMGYVTTIYDFIITNPIALLGLGISLAFVIVSFATKLIRTR